MTLLDTLSNKKSLQMHIYLMVFWAKLVLLFFK